MDILLDIDGFFWPDNIDKDYMNKQRKFISINREPQPYDVLFEQYYLGFRSAMFISEDSIENENEAMDVLRTWREGCLQSAWNYAHKHITTDQSLPVDFMCIAREAIIHELRNEYPSVENIELRLSMKPRLSARTVDKCTIIFPALARTVFNHCNLVIINSYFQAVNDNGQKIGDIDRRQIARFIFPYLLFCHDDFSVQNLPIIGAHSQDAMSIATQITNLQVIFIFAHEYAHILLHHFDEPKANSNRKEDMENEADALALKVVLAYAEKSNGAYTKLDVLTAVRWLFKYQLIDNSIGIVIQGKSLEFSCSKTEDRRDILQLELMNTHGLRGSTLLESLGFCMLVELQGILYESGSTLINNIINIFHKSNRTEKIEPWWEQIHGSEYAQGQFNAIIDLFNKKRKEGIYYEKNK